MTKFDELLKIIPTLEWKERNGEDDDYFSIEIIDNSNTVLESYINSLKKLNNPTNEAILDCVKEVVLNINKLDEKYDYFIGSLEREELVEFINNSARLVGLEFEDDITDDWRDW